MASASDVAIYAGNMIHFGDRVGFSRHGQKAGQDIQVPS